MGLDDEGTGWTGFSGNTQSVTVGQTLIGAATGSIAPLFASSRKDRRSGAYMWVPVNDRIRWDDYRSEEAPGPEEEPGPEEGIHFSGRDADTACTFGDDTFVPSASLERRGIHSVELTFTVDAPAPHRNGPSHGETLTTSADRGRQRSRQMGTTSEPTQQSLIPAQPSAPTTETLDFAPADGLEPVPLTRGAEPSQLGLPASLIALQQAADLECRKLGLLDPPSAERTQQRRIWRDAAAAVQSAVTQYARAEGQNRFDVQHQLRRAARHDGSGSA
ncbi:hypothetical protein [Streptomyces chartreusis]|uniref:hypothetical protein n=1 Tax=Streptomyces chartreusis TaxID=1969 RepID=UPI003632C69B